MLNAGYARTFKRSANAYRCKRLIELDSCFRRNDKGSRGDIKSRNDRACSQHGILMLECLLAMAIMGVLLAVGVSGLREWVARQEARHVAERIDTMLFRARSLALLHHAPIRCCGSSDSVRCDGAWSKGWLLQEDHAHPYFYRVHLPVLTWHGGQINQASGIIFSPEGTLASSPGHFEWQNRGKRFRYTVSVSGVGHLASTSKM